MAVQVLFETAASLKSAVFYAVMAHETTEKANQEQVALVFSCLMMLLLHKRCLIGYTLQRLSL